MFGGMRPANRLLSPMLLAALLACATAPPGPPVRMTDMPAQPPPQAEQVAALGELQWTGAGGARSAAYSPWRVVGPTVKVSYTGNNTWAGTLDGRNFAVTVAPGRLTGAGIDLHLFQDGDATIIRGQWFQRSLWITLSPQRLSGHTANSPGVDLARVSPGVWNGIAGSGISSSLQMKGEAAQFPNVVTPHFYLALLAAVP